MLSDARYPLGDGDGSKADATLESGFSDTCHALGEGGGDEAGAVTEQLAKVAATRTINKDFFIVILFFLLIVFVWGYFFTLQIYEIIVRIVRFFSFLLRNQVLYW